jgi:hypothetical protein
LILLCLAIFFNQRALAQSTPNINTDSINNIIYMDGITRTELVRAQSALPGCTIGSVNYSHCGTVVVSKALTSSSPFVIGDSSADPITVELEQGAILTSSATGSSNCSVIQYTGSNLEGNGNPDGNIMTPIVQAAPGASPAAVYCTAFELGLTEAAGFTDVLPSAENLNAKV